MNILITCCLGDHIRSNVDDIRNAYPGSKIVGIDMREMHFNHNGVDVFYRCPRCDDPKYVAFVIDVCKKEKIDIVVSFSSLDIAPFGRSRKLFDDNDIVVALDYGELVEKANDKNEFYCLCSRNGLIIPKTSPLIFDSEELFDWMSKNNVSEVVTKVSDSTGAKGMNRYDIDSFDDYWIFDRPVIAQEYLGGMEYSVDCFCMHGDVVFSCVKKNYEMDLGVSIYSEIVDRQDIVDLCVPACKLFNLDGLVGFDLKEDAAGNVYVLECNPRPTATISLVSKAGVNLLGHLIEYYVTGSTVFSERIDYGMKIVRFREDYYFKDGAAPWKM